MNELKLEVFFDHTLPARGFCISEAFRSFS